MGMRGLGFLQKFIVVCAIGGLCGCGSDSAGQPANGTDMDLDDQSEVLNNEPDGAEVNNDQPGPAMENCGFRVEAHTSLHIDFLSHGNFAFVGFRDGRWRWHGYEAGQEVHRLSSEEAVDDARATVMSAAAHGGALYLAVLNDEFRFHRWRPGDDLYSTDVAMTQDMVGISTAGFSRGQLRFANLVLRDNPMGTQRINRWTGDGWSDYETIALEEMGAPQELFMGPQATFVHHSPHMYRLAHDSTDFVRCEGDGVAQPLGVFHDGSYLYVPGSRENVLRRSCSQADPEVFAADRDAFRLSSMAIATDATLVVTSDGPLLTLQRFHDNGSETRQLDVSANINASRVTSVSALSEDGEIVVIADSGDRQPSYLYYLPTWESCR